MGLNARLGIFHPDFFYHPRPTIRTSMLAQVEVYKPTGVDSSWNPTTGHMDNADYSLVWRSRARVQPDKDWRARNRLFEGQLDGTIAVRVQLPIGENDIEPAPDLVQFGKDFRVDIISCPVIGGENMEGRSAYVRNAATSSNLWVYNLLCDMETV